MKCLLASQLILLFVAVTPSACTAADDFPDPINTQAAGEHPPLPQEMLELFELPPGFNVTLFAGEPDVRQPIAFDFDDRGRIWVAENYSYGAHGKYDAELRDRVIILHDTDGDGQHDERKVFWDEGWMLTGLTWGFGGLWVLNDGTLSFIPDKDGNDVPDGEPVEMLNGWTKSAGHNFVSGLLWGPDGWLYGRHGITDTSYPGTPDTPQAERQPMNCGIWRFHPTKHIFEVVCHGTTNPWGLDYNESGDMFMTNNVIGHLWHVIPGAHYERMFGQDFNPHLYELMSQTADHYHWDHSGKWSESRDGHADDLGGGHSHCGGMIYYGDNFPKEYRGKMFMCNTHGRCINVDRLERKGSSYVAKHEPNFLKVNTPWFRGVELKYGPRGCVYLTDWSDNGECHDHDGVHRTSGRIYRIAYGKPGDVLIEILPTPDGRGRRNVATNGDQSTEHALRHRRRILQQQAFLDPAVAGQAIRTRLVSMLTSGISGERKLEALWTLTAIDGLNRNFIVELLDEDNEALVAAAVKLGSEAGYFHAPPGSDWSVAGDAEPLLNLMETDQGLVVLALASSLQQLNEKSRVMLGRRLFAQLDRWDDDNLARLTWYGLVDVSPDGWRRLLADGPVPHKLLRFSARRGIQRSNDSDVIMNELLSSRRLGESSENQQAVLLGMLEGLRGQSHPQAPAAWAGQHARFADSNDPEVIRLEKALSVLFGDGAALKDLRQLLADRNGDHAARSMAVSALAQAHDTKSVGVFLSLLNDRAVYADVCTALAGFDDPRIPAELLKRWDNLRHGSRAAATDTMVSRRSYAVALAGAIDDGRVNSADLTATHVRQLLSFNEPAITRIIEAQWGIINDSSAARTAAIGEWKGKLMPELLSAANPENGAALFKKTCANCHKLYGEGGKIGPDLTGGNRANMDYLLGNVIDPSAVVPRQWTTSVIALTSGRVITGVVVAETDRTISVQTDKELMAIAISDVDERTRTNKSLMPDGLLDPLTEEQVRDLIAFVRKRR